MRQRGDEEPIGNKIAFTPVSGLIGSPGMGVVVHWISAKWKGDEVDEIPPGEAFDIIVNYTASWPEGSVSLINPWTVVFTAVCEQDESIRASGKTKFTSSPQGDEMILDVPKSIVMPAFDCTFRIRPWGHPDWELISLPPANQW